MPATFVRGRLGLVSLLVAASLAASVSGCSSAIRGTDWKAQKAYGVRMAKRGFWREALFRFQKAAAVHPEDAEVQNDLAVAYESVGETSNALSAYKKALELAPNESHIKRNYARFAEYYTASQRAASAPSGPTH